VIILQQFYSFQSILQIKPNGDIFPFVNKRLYQLGIAPERFGEVPDYLIVPYIGFHFRYPENYCSIDFQSGYFNIRGERIFLQQNFQGGGAVVPQPESKIQNADSTPVCFAPPREPGGMSVLLTRFGGSSGGGMIMLSQFHIQKSLGAVFADYFFQFFHI
jgi:hypothetical protein